MSRHQYVIDCINALFTSFPGGLLPGDMEVEMARLGVAWSWWQGTEVVRETVALEPREAYPGRVLPHYVPKRKGEG